MHSRKGREQNGEALGVVRTSEGSQRPHDRGPGARGERGTSDLEAFPSTLEGGGVAVLARGSNAAPPRRMGEGNRPSLHRPSTQVLSSIQDGFEDGALPHRKARPASSRPRQPREPRRGSTRLSGNRWQPVGCAGQKKGKGWRKQGGWRGYASCEATGAGSRLLTPNESRG